jgi:hypothetical protein
LQGRLALLPGFVLQVHEGLGQGNRSGHIKYSVPHPSTQLLPSRSGVRLQTSRDREGAVLQGADFFAAGQTRRMILGFLHPDGDPAHHRGPDTE